MLASRQPIIASLRRDAWVEVDLSAIEHNIKVVKSWLKPGTRLMAVVKSDAYGHGAVGVSEVLAASGADWFGVASLDEACQLREAGVKQPILILSPCPAWAMPTALEMDLRIAITSKSQIEDVFEAARRSQRKAHVHLKVDTGMHRLGVPPDLVPDIVSQLSGSKLVKLEGICSHLAKADDEATTEGQRQVFERALASLPMDHGIEIIHFASSDATRYFPDTHYHMVRPGLILYGLESRTASDIVRPAMAVRGRITQISEIEAGQSVGYNLTWTAARASRIASIPIGYADGIDRGLSNRITALLLGKEVQQVGLISMDQMLFDITEVPEAQDGDVVTLIGSEPGTMYGARSAAKNAKTLHLATWANLLDTITYELACRMRVRMPRIYTRPIVPSDRTD